MAERTAGTSGSTSGVVRNAAPENTSREKKKKSDGGLKGRIISRLVGEGYTPGSEAFDLAVKKYSADPESFDNDFEPIYYGKVPGNQPRDTRALEILNAFGFTDPLIAAFAAASKLQPGV